MSEQHAITFELNAMVAGREVTPKTIGLSLFNRFNREVERFIRANEHSVSLDDARVSIAEGSYRLMVMLPAAIAATVEPDVRLLQSQNTLDQLQKRRAVIVRQWQKQAHREEGYRVTISLPGLPDRPVRISRESDYHTADEDHWVAVEKYVVGRLEDIGGSTEANVHFVLENSGLRLKAVSSEEYLRDLRNNYIYHRVQLHIAGQENIKSGELRAVRLLAFVGEGPSYDEAELETLIEKGTKAWADIPDSVAWVREQRGNYDD